MKSVTVSIVSPSICHEVTGLHTMILVFWMLSFKTPFSLSSFTFIERLFSSSSISAIRVVSSTYLRLLIFLPATLIPACASSSPAFHTMYSAYKLNKQGDNMHHRLSRSEMCHFQGEVGQGGILQGRAWLASPPRSRSWDRASVVLGLWGTPCTGPAPRPPLGPWHERTVSVVPRRPQTAGSSISSHGWACPQWHPRSPAKGPSPDYSAHGIRDSAHTHLVTHPLYFLPQASHHATRAEGIHNTRKRCANMYPIPYHSKNKKLNTQTPKVTHNFFSKN